MSIDTSHFLRLYDAFSNGRMHVVMHHPYPCNRNTAIQKEFDFCIRYALITSRLLRILLLAVFAICISFSSSISETKKTENSQTDNPVWINTQISFIRSKIVNKQRELEHIRNMENTWRTEIFDVESANFRSDKWDELLESLKQTRFVKENDQFASFQKAHQIYRSFSTLAGRIFSPITFPIQFVHRMNSTGNRLSLDQGFYSRWNRLNFQLIKTSYDKLVEEQPEWKDIVGEQFVILGRLPLGHVGVGYYLYPSNINVSDSVEKIRELVKTLGSPPQKILQFIKNQSTTITQKNTDFLRKESEKIESEITGLEKSLVKQSRRLSDLKQLRERESEIDRNLVYAVYGMIVALVVLFLGLRVFSKEVASELISKRSLVEVIGMAFMLITIIILGTGGKLEEQVLGTLLGTIAGYIFARSVQRNIDDPPSRNFSNSEQTR